jgi:ubiquitin-protein ligase E3 B
LPSCKLITTSLHGKRWCLERPEFSDFHSTSHSNKEVALVNPVYFQVVVTGLLESCQNYVVSKQSNLTHWHPVLGWFAQPMDPSLNAAMPHVKIQLNLLWNSPIVQILLGNVLQQLVQNIDSPQPTSSPQNSNFSGSNFFKKVLESRSNKTNTQRNYRALGSPEVHRVVLVCSLYHTALNTLTQLQLDILTGCTKY